MTDADPTPATGAPAASVPPDPPRDFTGRPALRIVRGDPSAEDLAALTALLAAPGGSDDVPPPAPRGRFADPSRLHRQPLRPGPGGWRASSS